MGGDTACLPGRAPGRVEADIRLQEVEENHSNRGIQESFAFALYAGFGTSGCDL